MFWNNPLIETRWPSDIDPIKQSMHNSTHCLFYDPKYEKLEKIITNQTLAQLCHWASSWITTQGIDKFVADQKNHYDIANLVKLNMWIADIRIQGIVKPWLLLDCGNDTYVAGTGDSRLRALECIPEIQTVPAFISTKADRAHLYTELESVTSFDQFAHLCGAVPGNSFLFRLTDAQAPYGLYWYEYNTSRTRAVTPSESEAVDLFVKYMRQHPATKITPTWFNTPVTWINYSE